MIPSYVVSADLGQASDPTAICVVEQRMERTTRLRTVIDWLGRASEEPRFAASYTIIHLERIALGTSYVDVVPRVQAVADRCRQLWLREVWREETEATKTGRRWGGHPTLADAAVEIVLDQTGVGRPVIDIFRAAGIAATGVVITGGDGSRWASSQTAHVSKRQLVSTTQALLQSRRVRAAAGLADWPTLRGLACPGMPRLKLDPPRNGATAHMTISCWRSR